MATIKLTNGERYTFAKTNNNPVIQFASDFATNEMRINNNCHISQSNGNGRLKITSNNTNQFYLDNSSGAVEVLRLENINSSANADTYIQFAKKNSSSVFQYFNLGIDRGLDATNCPFVISTHVNGLYSNRIFRLNKDGKAFFFNDLSMEDTKIVNIRELQLKDFDDDGGGDDNSVRVLRRDDNWNHYAGGVTIGDGSNGYFGDIGHGELGVKTRVSIGGTFSAANHTPTGRLYFGDMANSGNETAIVVDIDGEHIGWLALWRDDDNETNERLYIGYDASSREGKWTHFSNDHSWKTMVWKRAGNLSIPGTLSEGSDIRLKKDVSTITGSLDRICKLRPVHYVWKDDKTDRVQTGLIAQEVEHVFPELVDIEADARPAIDPETGEPTGAPQYPDQLSVRYTQLTAHLIDAIQEQQVMIEDLKARLSKLEEK